MEAVTEKVAKTLTLTKFELDNTMTIEGNEDVQKKYLKTLPNLITL